jgi:sn-glycerol 3-phosphate transport system substrate-binding protein
MKKTLPALLLPLLLLCACAQAAEEIRVWHAMSGPIGASFDQLVERFNASQKEYRVKSFFQGPYDEVLADELEVRKRSGDAPHVVQVQDAGTADMLRSGAARALWQVLEDAGLRLDARYLPAVATYFSDGEGRLLALPFGGSTPVLYYNRAAFRRAGLDASKPPRTWYEMPRMLAALVEAGQGCALTTTRQSWVLVENMSAWHNQRFATQANGMAGANPRLAFNTRLMVRWISTLSSWNKSGYYTPSGRRDEAEARFAAGECAMLTAPSAAYARLRNAASVDFGVAPLPYYEDFDEAPQNTLIGGSAFWTLGGMQPSAYRGAARFLAFLAQPGVQADWHQETGDLPLTAAGYELSRKQGYYISNPDHEVAVRQLLVKPTEDSRGVRLDGLRRIRDIIDEELDGVWLGSKTPLDALNAAVKRGNAVLERAR